MIAAQSARRLAHDWHPAPLPASVAIGEGSWLYSSYAFVHCRSRRASVVRIGRASGVYDGTLFDLGPDGEVAIGDYCTVVGAIFAGNVAVSIGDYSFLAHEVVVAESPFATPDARASPLMVIEVGTDVWVGAQAVLLGGAKLGNGAVVGARTVVDFEVPAGAIVAGQPARIVGRSASPQ